MLTSPARIISVVLLISVAFILGKRCNAQPDQTNKMPTLESVEAAKPKQTNQPSAAPVPPPPRPRTPVYVLRQFEMFRTGGGMVLATDQRSLEDLMKLWPSTQVMIIWTPDGPVQFFENVTEQVREQFRGEKGTNLVFYAPQQ